MSVDPLNVNQSSSKFDRLRLVFYGSGEFGLPTLKKLATDHDVALVVTQPDRPAGRHRVLTPTPIADFAGSVGIPCLKPCDVNKSAAIEHIGAAKADVFVVIAFGQKLGQSLLQDKFAINLHASLLPKYRGAAPINRAIINGERETGISVIGLAPRMDAGPIYAQVATRIDSSETAGELHDRLAALGPEAVLQVLSNHQGGRLIPQHQDERLATRAPKLAKSDGTVHFDQAAERVRNRIHGLTPWPGCTVQFAGRLLKLLRVEVADVNSQQTYAPGVLLEDLSIACSPGTIRLLEVQPPGGNRMSFEAYCNGQAVRAGMKVGPHIP